MIQKRKRYPDQDKVAILKQHLVEKKPLSDLCDAYGIHPTMFYRWQKQFFENGAAAFAKSDKPDKTAAEANDRKIAALEAKLQQKNEVLAELMQEYVQLKKERGEP
jgi:transposase